MSLEPIPPSIRRLLWDVDPESIDLLRDQRLIFERVMTRGTWDAMTWLRRQFSKQQIAAFISSEGARRLTPRDLAYWALVSDVEIPPLQGGGRPPWAGK